MSSRNWSSNVVTGAVMADKSLSQNKETCINACTSVLEKLRYVSAAKPSSSDLVLDYIGNGTLLASPDKVSLICHRMDELFFAQQTEAVLSAARSGSIVVSAFVSKKEIELRNMLLRESLPVIEVMCNGFSPGYLPYRASYDACVAGRCVQITPWIYDPAPERRLTREMCLAMNQLVRVISKTPDDWWRNWK